MEAYRLALFLSDVCWLDASTLGADRRTLGLSDQLYRSVGSIGANLVEGYSRGSGRDRARFYEHALGSARESRDWYCKGRHILGDKVSQHRMAFTTQIIRLLLTTIPTQRRQTLREEQLTYHVIPDELDRVSLENPVLDVPIPDPSIPTIP
jgi:four helix bundle protein